MTVRDLLVLGAAGTEAACAYGTWLSAETGAFLTGAIPVVPFALPTSLTAELPEGIVARLRDEAETAASKGIHALLESARSSGARTYTLEFVTAPDDVGSSFSRLARCFDLSILQQPDPGGPHTGSIIEDVLFGSGRPLLVVPYIHVRHDIANVLIGWDGGIQAARAVSDALPLLRRAHRVRIVTIGQDEQRSHRSSQDLARHLARHDIVADVKLLPGEAADTANMLLSYAADSGADLIVMGGYGHSRLRELALGGTTREILRSMTVPVFMSH